MIQTQFKKQKIVFKTVAYIVRNYYIRKTVIKKVLTPIKN